MCNEVARRIALGQLREDWSQLKIPLLFPEGLPNLAPLDSIRITDTTLVIRAANGDAAAPGSAEAIQRRWSWPGPGGKPVYNYRSDGRDLRTGRCLIPVDAFYEFTTPAAEPGAPKAKRKHKWAFAHAADDWFCIAGLWRSGVAGKDGAPVDGHGEAFTLLTTEPGPDVAPYHSRQVVVLPRSDWAAWLDGSGASRDLCRPAPAGTFRVTPAS
ncbi:SOS response-associated peptidase family protein [Sphingomonas sp. Tas61C01]|uniref:SOS response-associated peptidase family protein n=1 Tax=Sphingomonas sp. Tas61C01 TaxID=3458297 RepID=UPI00403E7875